MRLIDADVENGKLLDFIAEHDNAIQYALEHKDMTMLEDIFFEYFEAQKTAYDVDKVKKNLRAKMIKAREGQEFLPKREVSIVCGYIAGISEAIEIVKAGVVSEDN